jgi:hypothetical protein
VRDEERTSTLSGVVGNVVSLVLVTAAMLCAHQASRPLPGQRGRHVRVDGTGPPWSSIDS